MIEAPQPRFGVYSTSGITMLQPNSQGNWVRNPLADFRGDGGAGSVYASAPAEYWAAQGIFHKNDREYWIRKGVYVPPSGRIKIMINRGPRNQSLLARIPETNPFRATLVQAIFGIGNAYDRDLEAIAQDGRLSAEGKREKVRERRQEALGKLTDLRRPVDDYRKESERMRSGIKAPSYDRADILSAMHRRELRDLARTLNFGQRTMRMTDKAFRDAVLEMPPWVSGFNESEPNELALYQEAKAAQERDLNGPLIDALDARADVEAELAMISNIVTTDIKGDDMYRAETEAARDRFVAAATA